MMLKKSPWENNGMGEIGLVTPNPEYVTVENSFGSLYVRLITYDVYCGQV